MGQARRALQLYAYYTESGRQCADRMADAPGDRVEADRQDLIEAMGREVRLKHLSYRAEMTCRGWLSRFLSFVEYKRSVPV